MSQMRQSEMCEPNPPIHGNSEREYDGLQNEKQNEEWVGESDPLQKGTPSVGKEYINRENKNGNGEDMPGVRKNATAQVPITVGFNSQGRIAFSNQQELGTAARLAIQMNLAPDHLKKEGLQAVMSAMVMCRQLGLIDAAMNKLAYVKGKLVPFGSLVTAIAETHPEYGEREDFFLDDKQERISVANKNLNALPWAAVVRNRKKNSTIWNEYFFTILEAEQAGLYTKNTKPDSGWMKYTKDMLFYKANKRMLDANYASVSAGLDTYEDIREVYDVTPGKETTSTDDLNKELT